MPFGPDAKTESTRRSANDAVAKGRPPRGQNGPAATVGHWQQQLMRAATLSVEALAGAGQVDAALRIAIAAERINSSPQARFMLAGYLERAGAKAQAEQVRKEGAYGR